MNRYWWVNQGQSYEAERREGILWAPLRTADGRGTRIHWDNLDRMQVGDLVVHYADQQVRALSTVVAPAVRSRRPDSLPTDMWEQDGRLVRVQHRDATRGVGREDIPEAWRRAEPADGPFQTNAGVKLGYLFPLTAAFFHQFDERFGHRFDPVSAQSPRPVAQPPGSAAPLRQPVAPPPEALAGAGDLLRRLIGLPLTTAAGRANVILGVRGNHVIVGTDRSPEGQPVPVSEVQAALDRLVRAGTVAVTPETVGHRSAFIGAVLATLPGAVLEGSPPEVRLTDTADTTTGTAAGATTSIPDESRAGITFEGDLAIAAQTVTRGEQAALRRHLFGSATTANCALCGERYPVRFLWAAHIKRRSVCSDPERRDLAHVAMAACVFGCDALFETGYLAVDDTGHVVTSAVEDSPTLAMRLKELHGRGCLAFTSRSAQYFQWHRDNVWRG